MGEIILAIISFGIGFSATLAAIAFLAWLAERALGDRE